jgi:hypothetical protein
LPSFEPALDLTMTGAATVADAVRGAVRLRVRASQMRAERAMRGMGTVPRAVEARRRSAIAEPASETTPSNTEERP